MKKDEKMKRPVKRWRPVSSLVAPPREGASLEKGEGKGASPV
ncbi:hypothetical protein [Hydrogenimonas sp.]